MLDKNFGKRDLYKKLNDKLVNHLILDDDADTILKNMINDIPNKIYECSLCGYTSDDSANFEDDICLMCLRIHDMDY